MKQSTLSKIKEITTKIQDLEGELKKFKETLSQDLLSLLTKNNAFSYDFETLTGGILSVLKTLSKSNDENQKQLELWKKEGASSLNQKRKPPKPKSDT